MECFYNKEYHRGFQLYPDPVFLGVQLGPVLGVQLGPVLGVQLGPVKFTFFRLTTFAVFQTTFSNLEYPRKTLKRVSRKYSTNNPFVTVLNYIFIVY